MNNVKPKWYPLFLSNFFGVFNDNFLKNGIIFIAVAWSLPQWLTYSQLITYINACLILPYLFFSPIGGRLAVRFLKTDVLSCSKLVEICILVFACIGFYYQSIILVGISMFLMGIVSCLYSPSKYSLIRDIGGDKGVSYGSGFFETMAFLGVLLGTFSASLVSDHYAYSLLVCVLLVIGGLGYCMVRLIRVVEFPPQESGDKLNPLMFVIQNYKLAKKYNLLNSAVFGSSVFWLISNMMQMNILLHCKREYGLSNSTTGAILAFAAIGIASGTMLAGYYSGATVKKGLILPALGVLFFILSMLFFVKLPLLPFILLVLMFAFVLGVFQVPCMAIVQFADLGRLRGNIIAYLNMVNFIFILFGTALFGVTTLIFKDNSLVVFAIMGLIVFLSALYFWCRASEFRRETSVLRKNL